MPKTECIMYRTTEAKRDALRRAAIEIGAGSAAELLDFITTAWLLEHGYLGEKRPADELLPSNSPVTTQLLGSNCPDPPGLFSVLRKEKELNQEEGECEGGKPQLPPSNRPVTAKQKPALNSRQQALLATAEMLCSLVLKACRQFDLGKPPGNDPGACAVILEQVVRLDGVAQADLLPLARWMLASEFWRANVLSIRQWRKEGKNGRAKILNARAAWIEAGAPGRVSRAVASNGAGDESYVPDLRGIERVGEGARSKGQG